MSKSKVFQNISYKNNIAKQKKDLAISIHKNIECLELLEIIEQKYSDLYNFSQLKDDRINLEKIKWIKFQIEFNIKAFEKTLKSLGGDKIEVQLSEWE